MSFTPSENILHLLARKSFLSLWSYPNVYNDKGIKEGKGDGKEIADLLVVFGQHVLIFSDKKCAFPSTGDIKKDWKRWKRRAIDNSIKQLRGAERWVKNYPSRVFLDKRCTQKLHAPIPKPDDMIIHSIIVANGAAQACKNHHGQSGSLILHSDTEIFNYPFAVGQPEDGKRLVHIFDEENLEIIMSELDTVSDFISYLTKKEELFASGVHFSTAGEEDLLAFYLGNVNGEGEHDFIIPKESSFFSIDSHWASFQKSKSRKRRIQLNSESYAWDQIIDKFNYHAINNSLHFTPEGGILDHEQILRYLAAESRVRRRVIVESIFHLLKTTPVDQRGIRVLTSKDHDSPTYLFLLLPKFIEQDNEKYREVRLSFLYLCCLCVPLVYSEAKDIIGFATETDQGKDALRTEDLIYYDARNWSSGDKQEAEEVREKYGIFKDIKQFDLSVNEYS